MSDSTASPALPNKEELFSQLRQELQQALEEHQSGIQPHPDNPPDKSESDWANHHFQLEATAVALVNLRGLRHYEQGISDLRDPTRLAGFHHRLGNPATIGSLVTLGDPQSNTEEHYLISPVGGGNKLQYGGFSCTAVTPQSPIGLAIMDQPVGTSIEVEGLKLEITAIR